MTDKIATVIHDADARNNTQILQLIRTHGYEGYGLYWALIEIMLVTEEHKLTLDNVPSYAFELRIEEPEKLSSVIERCCEVKLFEKENAKVQSPGLLKRIEKFREKRDQTRAAVKKRWDAHKQKDKEKHTDKCDTPVYVRKYGIEREIETTNKKDLKKDRVEFGEFISFKPETAEKLKSELGSKLFKTSIEVLHDWIAAQSPMPGERETKAFKDAKRKGYNAAHTFRSWVVKEARKRILEGEPPGGARPKLKEWKGTEGNL